MTKTSPSSNSHKKIGKQPNTKIRKLRKKIKKYHQNIQDKTVTSTGIISYSNRRQKNQKRKTFATSMLAIAILLGSGGLVIMLGWISILFIFNPQQVSWLNDFVPGWVKIGSSSQQSPRTMQQIQSEIQKQKRIVGEIIALESDIDESFLLPVFRQRNNCHSDCKSIVELRTYH
ncbi:MAG: hypothetical protein HC874_20080 [Richelia sp. SL_2_1]|nr:hypothetical protein [Richelia sp. SL_2_1]